MAPESLVNYENAPVNEVVIGLRFRQISSLLIPHFGQFWAQIKDQYPFCEHAPPFSDDGALVDPSTGMLLPRVWLVSTDKTQLVQLQNTRFYFNWRQTPESKTYPRFSAVLDKFTTVYRGWRDYVTNTFSTELTPVAFELTYLNTIEKAVSFDPLKDIGSFMRDFNWENDSDRFLPRPISQFVQAQFEMDEGAGTLSMRVMPAVLVSNSEKIIRLELTATTPLNKTLDPDDIFDWLPIARKWIVLGFRDLTREDVQRNVWKRVDENT